MLGFSTALAAFRDIGSLLVRRGTVMGPMLPLLAVAVVFALAAYSLQSVAVILGVPLLSAAFAFGALAPVFSYIRQFARFAKHDPDRLQSEEYRLQTMQQTIVAKGLSHPVTAERLRLADPTENPVKATVVEEEHSS